ncbi:MAG: ATP synthase F0 subunit B [SAR202 cluster bacterium Casp-Chloro-G4]|nr:F0F1 ATP synthase subunit B [Chloroflexota bacterium]MDA1227559.1 F0F1 ATP synthase subunit B [Chloroflexota bacterium]PKB61510.1 MAG: ATP synthase F0 subunit B [SAR202 cluster bacterium Casp-Chloro-G4]
MGALGINLVGLITQIVSFVILFAILYKLLYRPILGMLEQRANRIQESLETADRVRQEATSQQEAMQGQIEAARTEGQQLIAQAREVADRFREEELAKARQDIEGERTRATANIQRERDAAIEDLRREFAGMAIMAAERVIERSLDAPTHQDIINRVLEEGNSRAGRN